MNAIKMIKRRLANALTVGDLLAKLEGLPEDMPVAFVCDYGDHCHTQQVLPITKLTEIEDGEELYESPGYSHSGVALRECGDDEDYDAKDAKDGDGEDAGPKVLLLRS